MKPEVAAIRETPNGRSSMRADSHWPQILTAVEDRNVRPADLVRLILKEMSLACRELHAVSGHSSLEFKLKPLVAEVHALRTLADTVRYETELAVETDIVNLDGPKFRYVLSELMTAFKDSIREAGYDVEASNRILRAFRDNVSVREPDIRRKIKNVTAQSEGAEASVWPTPRPANGQPASEGPTK
jgi:hypothetical protein